MRPVDDYLDALERDQSPCHHFVEVRENGIDLFLRIDAFDDDRHVEGEVDESRGVNATAGSVAHDTARHRRAGQVPLPEQVDDCPVQRLTVVFVTLTNVDAHEDPL